MLRIIRYILWLAIAILGLFLGYQSFSSKQSAPPPVAALSLDKFAPPLQGVDYKAQNWTVVNFFASWCVPCRAEHPLLQEIAEKTAVIGVAWKDTPKDTENFLQELGNPYQQVIADPEGVQNRLWRIEGIPATFVIDAEGKVRYRRIGPLLSQHLGQIQKIMVSLLKTQ